MSVAPDLRTFETKAAAKAVSDYDSKMVATSRLSAHGIIQSDKHFSQIAYD